LSITRRRRRAAARDVRVRRDPPYLRRKIGQPDSNESTRTARLRTVAFLANGEPWAHGGQNHHFGLYAPEKLPYAIDRLRQRDRPLYAVLNRQLADREFIVGHYSIADIASYPWVQPERQRQNMDDFPHLKRWKEAIRMRPATLRAYAKAKEINPGAGGIRTDAERKILFGQTKDVVK
jgi:GST-like protein